MTHLHAKQRGFSVIEVFIVIIVLAVVGYIVYMVMSRSGSAPQTAQNDQTAAQDEATSYDPKVSWMATESGFRPSSTPPACPSQMIKQFPVDVSSVTGVLYPGQVRGGNYKPHGGLRFDDAKENKVTVRAPFDGVVISGAAYLADTPGKDVQYTFDVMNECGMMYRVGHFYTLSPELQEVAKNFPAPTTDSRTTWVNPPVKVLAGTVMATVVGTASDGNTFFDLGVYDWNKPNAISTDATWLKDARHNNDLAKHAVCWFDVLSAADETAIRALPPGDPTSAKNSDYCK